VFLSYRDCRRGLSPGTDIWNRPALLAGWLVYPDAMGGEKKNQRSLEDATTFFVRVPRPEMC
jgi:hypothetical protein